MERIEDWLTLFSARCDADIEKLLAETKSEGIKGAIALLEFDSFSEEVKEAYLAEMEELAKFRESQETMSPEWIIRPLGNPPRVRHGMAIKEQSPVGSSGV